MIADGTPLVIVSHNPGHAQTSTTSNIYSHVIAAAEAKAAEAFDRFGDLVAPKSEDISEVKSQEVKKKAAEVKFPADVSMELVRGFEPLAY